MPPSPAPLHHDAQHHCFGCGADNPHGLHLQFTLEKIDKYSAGYLQVCNL